jgi:hypothetical protein
MVAAWRKMIREAWVAVAEGQTTTTALAPSLAAGWHQRPGCYPEPVCNVAEGHMRLRLDSDMPRRSQTEPLDCTRYPRLRSRQP